LYCLLRSVGLSLAIYSVGSFACPLCYIAVASSGGSSYSSSYGVPAFSATVLLTPGYVSSVFVTVLEDVGVDGTKSYEWQMDAAGLAGSCAALGFDCSVGGAGIAIGAYPTKTVRKETKGGILTLLGSLGGAAGAILGVFKIINGGFDGICQKFSKKYRDSAEHQRLSMSPKSGGLELAVHHETTPQTTGGGGGGGGATASASAPGPGPGVSAAAQAAPAATAQVAPVGVALGV